MRRVKALTRQAVRRGPAAGAAGSGRGGDRRHHRGGRGGVHRRARHPRAGDRPLPRRRRQGDLDVRHRRARAQGRTGGCDVVVAQGTEAGGHTGKVAAMALIPQTVDAVRIPVLGAGAIVDGSGFVAALALGAQGVWMGTRFIATKEARAARQFKRRIIAARGSETVVTRCYSGKPMRVISNPYVEEQERHPGGDQALSRADGAQRHGRGDELRRRRRHRPGADLHAGGAGDRRHRRHAAGGRGRAPAYCARRETSSAARGGWRERDAGAVPRARPPPARRGAARRPWCWRRASPARSIAAASAGRQAARRAEDGRALRRRARLAARGAALPRAAGGAAHQSGPAAGR